MGRIAQFQQREDVVGQFSRECSHDGGGVLAGSILVYLDYVELYYISHDPPWHPQVVGSKNLCCFVFYEVSKKTGAMLTLNKMADSSPKLTYIWY